MGFHFFPQEETYPVFPHSETAFGWCHAAGGLPLTERSLLSTHCTAIDAQSVELWDVPLLNAPQHRSRRSPHQTGRTSVRFYYRCLSYLVLVSLSYLAQTVYPIQFLIQRHSQKYLLVCTYSTLTPLMHICPEWGLGLLEVHHHLFSFGASWWFKVIPVLNRFPALILLLSEKLLYMVGLWVVIEGLCVQGEQDQREHILLQCSCAADQRVKLAVSWSRILSAILSPLLSPSVFVKRGEAGWY